MYYITTKYVTWSYSQHLSFLTSSDRPTGPPPSYPPPPVPAVFHVRHDSTLSLPKVSAPPVLSQHRIPTSPLPKKPSVTVPPPPVLKDSSKGPPPPIPFAPHLHKSSSDAPPPPPPSNLKKTFQNRATSVGGGGNDRRERRLLPAISVQTPATLPICEKLQSRMVLNGPAHCSLGVGGSQLLSNNHKSTPHCANTGVSSVRPVTPDSLSVSQPSPGHSPHSPQLRSGLHNKIAKPPPPAKPSVFRAKPKQPGTPLQ